jgi:hypothetical protein
MTSSAGAFHEFEHAGWEKAASEYDRRFGELTRQSIGPLLDAAGATPGSRLLDVACGPGYVAAAANPELEFREGDAEKLDLADSSFDAVVMNFGMLHLERPERAIAEAFRVLSPGGRYAFTVWDLPERAVAFGIILESIQAYGNMDVPLPAGPPFFRFSDPEESKKTLTQVGFVNAQTIQVPQTWKVESGEALLATFQTAAVRTAALLNGQTPAALKKIQAEIESRVEAFRSDGEIVLSMPAILTSGLRPNAPAAPRA